MYYTSLTEAVAARMEEWDQGKTDIGFMGLELAGEAGELTNVIKKLERERLGLKGSRATVYNAAEELGDVLICALRVAKKLGIDLEMAAITKFNQTSEDLDLETMCLVPLAKVGKGVLVDEKPPLTEDNFDDEIPF